MAWLGWAYIGIISLYHLLGALFRVSLTLLLNTARTHLWLAHPLCCFCPCPISCFFPLQKLVSDFLSVRFGYLAVYYLFNSRGRWSIPLFSSSSFHLVFTHQIPCSIYNLLFLLLLGCVVLACVRVPLLSICRLAGFDLLIYFQILLVFSWFMALWSLWRRLDITSNLMVGGGEFIHNLRLNGGIWKLVVVVAVVFVFV